MSFSPDDQLLLIPSWDGSVQVREVATGKLRREFQGTGAEAAECTPDGKTLVVARSDSLQLYPLELAEPGPALLERQRRLIAQLNHEAIAQRETAAQELRRIGFAAEAELRKAAKESPFAEVRIRARRLRLEVRKPEPSHVLGRYRAELEALAVSPKGDVIAVGDKNGVVRLWDLGSRQELATLLPAGEEKRAVLRVEY